MTYVIYADVMFLWILSLNYLSYYITCKIINTNMALYKIFLWSFITSIFLEITYIYSLNTSIYVYNAIYVIVYFLLFNLFIKLGLKIYTKQKIINIITLNFLAILLIAGVVELIKREAINTYLIFPVLIVCLTLPKILELIPSNNSNQQKIYPISLEINKHTIKTIGYMDTGNTLHDIFNKKPVIVIDYKILRNVLTPTDFSNINQYHITGKYNFAKPLYIGENIIYPLPYQTISSNFAIMPAFNLNSLSFDDTKETYKNIVAAISQKSFTGKYNVLLNESLNKTREEYSND